MLIGHFSFLLDNKFLNGGSPVDGKYHISNKAVQYSTVSRWVFCVYIVQSADGRRAHLSPVAVLMFSAPPVPIVWVCKLLTTSPPRPCQWKLNIRKILQLIEIHLWSDFNNINIQQVISDIRMTAVIMIAQSVVIH